MRQFYANLRQGHDKAEALTLAKRELLRMNGTERPSVLLGRLSASWEMRTGLFQEMTMSDLTRTDRDAIVSRSLRSYRRSIMILSLIRTMENPRSSRNEVALSDAAATSDFETALSGWCALSEHLMRFFHERSRKKVPKGLAARFQYCHRTSAPPRSPSRLMPATS